MGDQVMAWMDGTEFNIINTYAPSFARRRIASFPRKGPDYLSEGHYRAYAQVCVHATHGVTHWIRFLEATCTNRCLRRFEDADQASMSVAGWSKQYGQYVRPHHLSRLGKLLGEYLATFQRSNPFFHVTSRWETQPFIFYLLHAEVCSDGAENRFILIDQLVKPGFLSTEELQALLQGCSDLPTTVIARVVKHQYRLCLDTHRQARRLDVHVSDEPNQFLPNRRLHNSYFQAAKILGQLREWYPGIIETLPPYVTPGPVRRKSQ